jgi:hypothetical protein
MRRALALIALTTAGLAVHASASQSPWCEPRPAVYTTRGNGTTTVHVKDPRYTCTWIAVTVPVGA